MISERTREYVRVLREKFDSFVGSGGGDNGVAAMLKQCGYDAANRRFIVDYEDSFLLHEDVRLRGSDIVLRALSAERGKALMKEGPIAESTGPSLGMRFFDAG